MYEIGRSLIPTIRGANDDVLDFTLGVDYIKKMMDSGKIARTPNVEMFVNLMEKMNEVERKFGIPPKR